MLIVKYLYISSPQGKFPEKRWEADKKKYCIFW